jgi:cellulose synthase/poly-beta-1,6-N-acetylglucosamine synthase-like glycosyltransferase
MEVSFVVPTVGRPRELLRFIEHLQAQRVPGLDWRQIELIVVDQSGSRETGELLAGLNTDFEIHHRPMAGRGASRARNHGWQFARGRIITFPDDDCHYPDGFLEQVLRKLDDPAVDAITVRVEFMSRRTPRASAITADNVLECCAEPGLFARRAALGDLRFDELMGIGAASPWNSDEGPDLVLRMVRKGLRIAFCPDLVIHHPNPMLVPDERLQQRNFSYSRGRGYFFAKHRYPLMRIGWSVFRSIVGSLYMAATVRPFWARYYYLSFKGKWQGLRGGRNAPAQWLYPHEQRETPAPDFLRGAG